MEKLPIKAFKNKRKIGEQKLFIVRKRTDVLRVPAALHIA